MKIIFLLIRSSTWKFFTASTASALSGVSFVWIIRLINTAVETKMENPSELGIQFLLAIIVYAGTSIVGAYIITLLSQSVIQEMRLTISNRILNAPYHKLEFQSKRLFTILTDDINTVSAIINKMPTFLTDAATILGCFGYMIYISPELFGLFMIVFLLAFLLYRLPLNSYAEKLRLARNHQNILFGHFEGLINGLKELNINKKFRSMYTEVIIKPLTEEQKKYQVIGKTTIEIFSRWGEIILLIGIGAILYIISQTGLTTYDTLIEFILVTVFAISPLTRVTRVLPDRERIKIALEQIETAGLSLSGNEIKTSEAQDKLPGLTSSGESIISLKEVTYSYFQKDDDKYFTLGPIDLEIKKGEVTFFIGGNGSGKSTLAKVLCGLYPPETGSVHYDGKEINDANLSDFKDLFNVIFSDFYLFQDLPHISAETIESKAAEYLSLLELDKKVQIINQKLTTTDLSTGQRKRLGLLISYLEDKPIYLFDEWAAGLDPYYKKIFYRKLIPDLKKQGKTILAITHDESYFDCADAMYMLKNGKLVEPHLLSEQLENFFD